MDRHTGPLSHDVPERTVDGAHGIVGVDTAAPIRRQPCHLPDIFDLVDVATDGSRLEVLLDGLGDDRLTFGVPPASHSVQPRLAREHLGVGHVGIAHLGQDHFDVGDLEPWQTLSRRHLRRLERVWHRSGAHHRGKAGAASRQGLERLTPVHRPWSVHGYPLPRSYTRC